MDYPKPALLPSSVCRRSAETSFYKAKLGLVYRTKIFDKSTNFLLNDEIYVGLKGSNGITRNKLTAGAQIDLFKWLKPVAMYVYQSYKGSEKHDHLFVVGLIVPLDNYGFFEAKK